MNTFIIENKDDTVKVNIFGQIIEKLNLPFLGTFS